MEVVLIAAVGENGVIGAGGAIPWRLNSDQQRLKTMTMGKPIVMGRGTFISLRRPLPGRTNIVITRDANFRARGAVVATSFNEARAVATGDALRRFVTEIFVIGGADGLSPDLRRKAKLNIAFGSATWPHQMVRVMLLEQVYRAATILAGHPYHRV